MKKTLTLFLLFVFLLNVLGFYGVFLGIKFSNDVRTLRAMDENRYSEEEITFAVPLTVPYFTDTEAEFKRVDGEFEHNGEVYRMVKQKLHRDTLYVVCIKDQASKDLNTAMADYVKTFSDKPSEKGHASKTIPSFVKDYVSTSVGIEPGNSGWNEQVMFARHADRDVLGIFFSIDSPPRIPGA